MSQYQRNSCRFEEFKDYAQSWKQMEVEGKFTCACGRSLEVLWNAPYMVIEAPKKAPNK